MEGGEPVGKGQVNLSYHWMNQTGDKLLEDGIRTALSENVYPNQSTESNMIIKLPQKSGHYLLRLSLVQEGVSWFYLAGGGYLDIPVKVLK
ncbi:hypothetical protein OMP38_29610 [Cohnella ginsengisoli]|uniref:Uncharacterized protein n=1 Tax=Cohnella ginsengisoli TaxID=425004 RepID=A0A9X4KLN1_9BACL|nr:hypothetical protein [Cohnella ginsengisoli]MDG0794534.1 hypothetical protein [Cohnella ginsengisoli]